MRSSSTCPFRYGSALYCDLPMNVCEVPPSDDGRSVIELLATSEPSTYRIPALPATVTATCFQAPVASGLEALILCSAPAPPVVIAKRAPPALLRGVRNM